MAYRFSITFRAERDLARIYERINANDSDAALECIKGLSRRFLVWKNDRTDVP